MKSSKNKFKRSNVHSQLRKEELDMKKVKICKAHLCGQAKKIQVHSEKGSYSKKLNSQLSRDRDKKSMKENFSRICHLQMKVELSDHSTMDTLWLGFYLFKKKATPLRLISHLKSSQRNLNSKHSMVKSK